MNPHLPPPRDPASPLAEPRPAAQDPSFYLPRIEPARFVRALLRRGWIAVLCALVAAAAAWWALSRVPETYLASGSVYVSTEAPRILDFEGVVAEESKDLEQLHSVEQGMLSSTLLLRLIDKHELLESEDFAAEPLSRQQALDQLARRVRVELRRGTRIIDIHIEDTDPERARELVESIKTEYEAWSDERRGALTEQLSAGLASEERRLRERMEASAARLQEFRASNREPGLDAGSYRVRGGDELDSLRTRMTQAQAERLRLEAEVEAFRGFDPTDPDSLAGLGGGEHTAEVLSLLRTLREKEVEFEKVKERYLHKHPVYKEIANEIRGLELALGKAQASAAEALEKAYRVALENESKLESAVEHAKSEAVDVDGLRATFANLTHDVEADRELHRSVARRLREAALAGSVPVSVLSWRERPLAPETPYRPRKMLWTPMAGMLGLMFGLVAVAGVEVGDRRVRDTAAAMRVTGTPLLARIPTAATPGRSVLVADPASPAADGFRRLRAVLIPPQASGECRTLLFASAKDGEGKSFCALNHAVALALQGHRTLLLDADLRRPGLSREPIRGSGPDRGLGAFLHGEAKASEACVATDVENLFLLSSGRPKDESAELLAGTRFPALLDEAHRWFDRVVIDAPGVLVASDVQAIARYADQTCLVVGEGASDRHELRRASELLRSAGAKLAGFVWNQRPARDKTTPEPAVELARTSLAVRASGPEPLPIAVQERVS